MILFCNELFFGFVFSIVLISSYIGRNKIKVAKAHPPRRSGDRGQSSRRPGSGRGGNYNDRSRYGRGGR